MIVVDTNVLAYRDCSAYDCEFVALAMTLGVKLVTMDGKLLKAFPGHTVALSAK